MPPTRGGWLRLGSQWPSAVATAGPEAAAAVTTRKCILFAYISESIATWMFAKHLEFFRISEHFEFFSAFSANDRKEHAMLRSMTQGC